MTRILLIVGLQLVAFWPVWRWYVSRLVDSSDQPWGLLALVTAFLFLLRTSAAPRKESSLLPVTITIVLYSATYSLLPPLARAAIAFTAIALTISSLCFGKSFHFGLLGLLYLSLPLLPSLQFFGGYPMRVVVAEVTAPILRLAGFAVASEGTCLNWAGQLIWIDAPCSGIKMLWVGLYLTFALVCLYELPAVKTALLLPLAFVVIMAGNVFRAVALFYLEAGVLRMPSWGHEYAGLVSFVLVSAAIVSIVLVLRREKRCGSLVST